MIFIADKLGVAQPTATAHLQTLARAGPRHLEAPRPVDVLQARRAGDRRAEAAGARRALSGPPGRRHTAVTGARPRWRYGSRRPDAVPPARAGGRAAARGRARARFAPPARRRRPRCDSAAAHGRTRTARSASCSSSTSRARCAGPGLVPARAGNADRRRARARRAEPTAKADASTRQSRCAARRRRAGASFRRAAPRRGAAGGGAARRRRRSISTRRTPEQLDTLPGVGPATAAKIVAYRQAARAVPLGRGARRGAGHRPGADRAAEGARAAVTVRRSVRCSSSSLCLRAGGCDARAVRPSRRRGGGRSRVARGRGARRAARCAACALALAGWWWGSDAAATSLDRSVLAASHRHGGARRRRGRGAAAARALRDARARASSSAGAIARPHEPVLLELPPGRAPPQGARLSVLGVLRRRAGRRTASTSAAGCAATACTSCCARMTWRIVGRRGGLGGVADRLHAWLARDGAPGLGGRAPRRCSRASCSARTRALATRSSSASARRGLYHLLAVSGRTSCSSRGGALGLALARRRLAALGRARGARCDRRVRARGRPAAVRDPGRRRRRARVARLADAAASATRWHSLLVAAIVLLAWNPYIVLDPGFQLSFAAVLSIFLLAPRFQRVLEGYPLPSAAAARRVAISAACGLGTAPVSLVPVPCDPARDGPGERRRRACRRAAARARARSRRSSRRSRTAARARARRAERLVRRLSRRLRPVLRRPAGRAGPLARGRRSARRRACSWRPPMLGSVARTS